MSSPFQQPKLNGAVRELVSEADPLFEKKADPTVRMAVEMAQNASGTVPAEEFQHWAGAKSTGIEKKQAEERRRRESLRRERQVNEDPEKVNVDGVIRAKYKIEVTFAYARKLHGENACLIQFWESGKRFHGGGDQLLHVCRSPHPDPSKQEGCGAFIPADDIQNGIAFCRNCMRQVNARMLSNEYLIVKRPTSYIAEKIAEFYRKMGSNADIYLKFHKTDIRYIAMERAKGPAVAARLKGMHIYPLHRIIQDTANGADLVKRFSAFLTS